MKTAVKADLLIIDEGKIALHKRVKVLKMDRDILKKVLGIFTN
jgi:hypothetical protein